MLPPSTEVLIVGAGPSGLALGVALARQGVDFLLIDRLAQGQNTSRAVAIHARTLEVLDALGVSEELVHAGLPTRSFSLRDRDRELLKVDFSDLATRYPYVLMLPQERTEAILAGALGRLGTTVQRRQEAVAVRVNTDGAEVDVAEPGCASQTVRARYVVAADGMHSRVREQAGIAFEPGTYAESFVLGDVWMDWPPGTGSAQLFLSETGLLLVAPFSVGHYRIIATLQDAPEHPGLDDLQAIVNARGPCAPCRIDRLVWSSRFRIHHGVAARYRTGPVFLVGDAAHVHSPAGGQGMNIGIQDACALGELLAAALRQPEDADALLDGYERRRRPVATRVVALTDRMTRLATLEGPTRRALRNLAVEALGHLPGLQHKLARQLAELDD